MNTKLTNNSRLILGVSIAPIPMFTRLFLLCLCSLSSLRAADQNVVIWKLDDVRAGEHRRLLRGFKRIADWAKANDTVVTMGVVCDSLATPNPEDVAWIKQNAIENGGHVEFWHHGWDHKTTPNAAGVSTYEFQGPDQATQARHLKDACAIFKQTTGLTFRAFGAPNNKTDDHTPGALDQCPGLAIWLYGPKTDTRRQILSRSINMEVATGKVSYEHFIQSYNAGKPDSPLVLQGHCGIWDDQSYADFVKIADFLKQNGWITRTASQYVNGHKANTAP